jgi:hypothetical protein
MYIGKKTYGCGRRTDRARNRGGRGGRVGLSWVGPLGSTLLPVRLEASLQLLWSLELGLFGLGLASDGARRRVAGACAAFGFHLEVLVHNALLVGVNKVLRDAAHAENLGVDTLAAFDGILDRRQSLFVDLLQVHRQATSSVEATVAVVATEVLCFLVGEEDSGVVEVALAVVTPRALDELLNLGVIALLDHACSGWMD